MEVNGHLHSTATVPQAKPLPVPIKYEAGWTPEPVWMLGKEKNLVFLLRTETVFELSSP
jgi:hypothetical protein